jgi:hypothetical protein
MPKVRLRRSPIFKFQFRKSLGSRPSLEETRTTSGSDGSIARTLGIENTNFANVWPIRRATARIEHAWSIGFARYIINASNAAGAEIRRVFEAAQTRSSLAERSHHMQGRRGKFCTTKAALFAARDAK